MKLAGRWILITGASSGFGAAAARKFAGEGCHLILGARRDERLADAAAAARAAGAASVHHHSLDVSRTAAVEAFLDWVRSITPRIDVLINNAGGAHGLDPVASARDEDWEAMVQSNFLGLLRMTRAVLPLLPQHDGAWILNVGSIAGHRGYEGGAAYCGVKAGVRLITESLRLELNGTGIRVGSIDPGMAETEFSDVRFKGGQGQGLGRLPRRPAPHGRRRRRLDGLDGVTASPCLCGRTDPEADGSGGIPQGPSSGLSVPRDAVPCVPIPIRCASPTRERGRGPQSLQTIPSHPSGPPNPRGLV